MLKFECQCGNTTSIFATGDMDEHGREYLELEDDDALIYQFGDDSIIFKCKFCGYRYRLQNYNFEIKN